MIWNKRNNSGSVVTNCLDQYQYYSMISNKVLENIIMPCVT